MKSNAPGQILGYTLQLQRALVYLLYYGPGFSVCVEVIGDVGVLSDSEIVSEEDKSSVNSNPVTNKSIDLWKTFYNWKKSINEGDVDLRNTKFILYSNHAGNTGIVDWLSEAESDQEVAKVLENIKEIVKDISEDHEIYSYIQDFFSNVSLISKIVSKFEFIVGSKSGDEEVKSELIKKFIPEGQVDFIHDELLGWVTNEVMNKVKNKLNAIITWEDFSKRFSDIFRRARSKELIDFTCNKLPTDSELKDQLESYPYYIQQLQIVGIDEDSQVRAVSDFLRSKVNMDAWIQSEIIDEGTARSFEEGLKRFWDNTRTRVMVTNKDASPEERGVVLYSECMVREEKLSNQSPPPSTVSGVYHSLSDEDLLGWHESWKNKLSKNKE